MLLKMHTYDFDIKLLRSKTSLIIPPANEENNPPQASDAAFQTAYWSLNPGYTFKKQMGKNVAADIPAIVLMIAAKHTYRDVG